VRPAQRRGSLGAISLGFASGFDNADPSARRASYAAQQAAQQAAVTSAMVASPQFATAIGERASSDPIMWLKLAAATKNERAMDLWRQYVQRNSLGKDPAFIKQIWALRSEAEKKVAQTKRVARHARRKKRRKHAKKKLAKMQAHVDQLTSSLAQASAQAVATGAPVEMPPVSDIGPSGAADASSAASDALDEAEAAAADAAGDAEDLAEETSNEAQSWFAKNKWLVIGGAAAVVAFKLWRS
jgi:hypothetical protein